MMLKMSSTWRRFVVLWLLMFWQGGFVFYASVVVTVGMSIVPMDQGWITQRVTDWLNLAGIAALAAWAWDIAGEASPANLRRRRWLLWLILVALHVALMVLHPIMDGHLDASTYQFSDHPHFHELHRWYLRVSTAQWFGAMLLTWTTLRTWGARAQMESN